MNGDWHNTRWIVAVNDHSAEIPQFGVVEVTGASINADNGRLILNVTRPTADSIQPVVVNSWKPIKVSKWGLVTFDGPSMVLYNSENTPAFGEEWGAEADVFTAGKDKTGFVVLGAVDTTNKIALMDFGVTIGYRKLVRFTLAAALGTSDENKTGTITGQYGPGIASPHTGAGSITVHSLETNATGTYKYSGDSGDAGYGYHDYGSHYRIIDMECE